MAEPERLEGKERKKTSSNRFGYSLNYRIVLFIMDEPTDATALTRKTKFRKKCVPARVEARDIFIYVLGIVLFVHRFVDGDVLIGFVLQFIQIDRIKIVVNRSRDRGE